MRAFLAIPLPETVRRAAAASGEVLAAQSGGWRFVREEGLHVTVRFLGEVDPSRLNAGNAAWREAAGGVGSIALRLHGARVLPPSGKPRVLTLAVVDETPDGLLAQLASRLELAARAQGFAPESRPFVAHITLARARNTARVTRPQVAPIGDCGAFVATRVVLYRSEPERGGSRYYEEASFPLTAGGGA
jgi:2'-5' RNA ligase